MSSFVRFGTRHLHTIISRGIIKPSSPTPRLLKTYNLSVLDQIAPDVYIPMVAFYPNSKNIYSLDLKKSLSQTLTRYYPFAGRLAKTTPAFVDCNDDGVEFIEAANDNSLSKILHNMHHEDLDQLFPNGLVWRNKWNHQMENDDDTTRSPLAVQVNSFSCGGIAIAVSLSHKIADGSSLCNFFNDWAIVTRKIDVRAYVSSPPPIDPYFILSKNKNLNFQGYSVEKSLDSCVTRSFMFPNSKLKDLKRRVMAMQTTTNSEQPIINPTRVEALNWLLYKCAVQAATENNGGSFQPTGLTHILNLRNKMMEPLPTTSIGNLYKISMVSTKNPNEMMPISFIGRLRKLKMEVEGIKDIESEIGLVLSSQDVLSREVEQRKIDEYYFFTSVCRYPMYGINFGLGKPVKVTIPGEFKRNGFVAMDVEGQNGNGILVHATLGKQDMAIFQMNPELLAYC